MEFLTFWYCPEYPVSALNPSTDHHPGAIKARPALKENIQKYGMVNPLIVWNMEPARWWGKEFIGTGNNRYYCIKELGWGTVPAVVQGVCPYEPKEPISLLDLPDYFKDGYPIIRDDGRLRMEGVTLPQRFEFPVGESNGKSEERC